MVEVGVGRKMSRLQKDISKVRQTLVIFFYTDTFIDFFAPKYAQNTFEISVAYIDTNNFLDETESVLLPCKSQGAS